MKPVLVVNWTHSGQARRAAESFTRPLADAGHEVVFVELKPTQAYPFPWNVRGFFSLFPETVLIRPAPIEPVVIPDRDWGLVIIASQVWFLSPSQPIAAFLLSPAAKVLAGRRVLTLVTCRNMWIRGWRRTVELIQQAGGIVTDRVISTHAGSPMASYFSTLGWMLTGRRDAIKALPAAGIDESGYDRLTTLGTVLAQRLEGSDGPYLADQDTASVAHLHAFGEQFVGAAFFPWMAWIQATLSKPDSALRTLFAWSMLAFVLNALFVLAPSFALIRLVFGRWIDPWLESRARLPILPIPR